MTSKELSCHKCGKEFAAKRYLKQHLNKRIPCDKVHKCNKCHKEFKTSQLLRNHKNRKTPCVPEEIPVVSINNKENKCHMCGNTYATAYNLKRHQKNCGVRNNPDLLRSLLEQNQELISIIKENGIGNQITNVQNITNNTVVQNNMYVNVTICSFGKEDLSRLDSNKVMQLLKGQVEDFMPKMIEHVHANPDHPEYHNVFYDPERQKAIVFDHISDTEMSWQSRDFSEVSANIRKRIQDYMRPGTSPYFDMAMQEKDHETSNKIIIIANEQKYDSPESLDKQKESLTQVTKNKDFLKLVEVAE